MPRIFFCVEGNIYPAVLNVKSFRFKANMAEIQDMEQV